MSPRPLPGDRFGRLVIQKCFVPKGTKRTLALLRCDCGKTHMAHVSNLKRGLTTSCGCWMRERAKQNATHGKTGSVEYCAWSAAKGRCFNLHNHAYARYGGRGVTMCKRWRSSFETFLADMGARPPGTSLDRYPDNNGNYEPGNCRWATAKQQADNRRFYSRAGGLNGCAKLTEAQAREILNADVSMRGSQKHLAQKFGISKATVSAIRQRRLWRHISGLYDPSELA